MVFFLKCTFSSGFMSSVYVLISQKIILVLTCFLFATYQCTVIVSSNSLFLFVFVGLCLSYWRLLKGLVILDFLFIFKTLKRWLESLCAAGWEGGGKACWAMWRISDVGCVWEVLNIKHSYLYISSLGLLRSSRRDSSNLWIFGVNKPCCQCSGSQLRKGVCKLTILYTQFHLASLFPVWCCGRMANLPPIFTLLHPLCMELLLEAASQREPIFPRPCYIQVYVGA